MAKGVTVSHTWSKGQTIKKIVAEFTADDGTPDALFDASATIGPIDGWIQRMVIVWGSTVPTTGVLDFTFKDSDGAPVLTAITDGATTAPLGEVPDVSPYVDGNLTVTCAGTNVVANATFKVILYVER